MRSPIGVLFATVILSLGACPVLAQEFIGCSGNTVLPDGSDRECTCPFLYNGDGTFEGALSWQGFGCQPPYYGAYAEGFDVEGAVIDCIVLWLTQDGSYDEATLDAYVWAGGAPCPENLPAEVLAVIPGIGDLTIPLHPELGPTVVEFGSVLVDGPFAIGGWGNWPGDPLQWYYGTDMDGPPGCAWTCVAPGMGYQTGWQHPSEVSPFDVRSMAFGVSFLDGPSPVESPTWGQIKTMFGK